MELVACWGRGRIPINSKSVARTTYLGTVGGAVILSNIKQPFLRRYVQIQNSSKIRFER